MQRLFANKEDLDTIKKIEELLRIELRPYSEEITRFKGNYYRSLNECIIELSITEQELFGNTLMELTEYLGRFDNLVTLCLPNNQISDITSLRTLKELRILYLDSNMIVDISPLQDLTNLSTLFLSYNQVQDISPLSELTLLSLLNLDYNQIQDVSPLQGLNQLSWLSLDNNAISDPTPLARLTRLDSLFLSNTQISDLTVLQTMTQLTRLSLGHNPIKDHHPIGGLTNLTYLNLNTNTIDDISFLMSLVKLDRLLLYDNQISDLTPLKDLVHLTALYLQFNQIRDLTPLKDLTELTELFIGHNYISNITPLQRLIRLTMLDLRYNKIHNIIPLKNLKELTSLDLSYNNIDHLPSLLVEQFTAIWYETKGSDEGLCIANNPFTDPPIEIVKQGREEILRYYQRKEREEFATVREAKLIFVGEGASGKTSLIIRLENPSGALPMEYERTRGIHITHWEMEPGFTAHMWDFGGQDVYYPVHRFYITENALFILIASTRNEQHNFSYWIPTIYQFGGDSPIIIGQTCHCGNIMPWNDLSIYTGNPLFNIVKNGSTHFYPMNLMDHNDGLEEIKREIIFQTKKLPHCSKKVPRSWVEVRQSLLERSIMCIPYTQFRSICYATNPSSFTNSEDYSDCCRFLNDIGSVFWYHKNEILREWVILKPELTSAAVYMLIDDKDIQDRFGHILQQDFERLWSDDQYRDHQAVLKEMLIEFKVAFSTKQNKSEYILPTLLESIPLESIRTDVSCVTLEYEFSFMMPRAIVNQLSANLSNYISIDTNTGSERVWNNAVDFLYEGQTKCQVLEDFYNRKIIVRASGKDARGLMMLVKDSLDSITSSYKGVKYEVKIPCTCSDCQKLGANRNMYKYNDLIRWYNEKGRLVVFCNESGSNISIHELLNDVGLELPIDPIEINRKNPTKHIKIFLASSNELAVERTAFEIFIGRENKRLIKSDIFLELNIWEDFIDAMSKTRLQDEYNRAVREADLFVSMFFTKVGKYTEEEFEAAFGQFKSGGRPLIYTYFKNADIKTGDIDQDDILSLVKFKGKLQKLGHYPTVYEDENNLLLKFKSQLDKLIDTGWI